MDPPMWAPFSNNRFGGDFPMHPSGISPPVTQSGVPYGGSGIQPMMPVENFNSPYMMSPYDNLMNKSSVVNDMNGSQQELPKSGMDLHPPVSNMSSSSAPLWSPMVSATTGALTNSDMPPKTAYSDLQFPGQMNRMSPIPSAGYQQNANSQQMTAPCSPAPQSPMLQRSQTPTHATDLRLDTNNRITPRAYPASQSPNATSPKPINSAMPDNYNHSNSHNPMGAPYSPYPSTQPTAAPSPHHVQSTPFTQQPTPAPQCFSSNATAAMKSPDSNSNQKITYPSVITHASSAHSTAAEDAPGHGEDLPNIDTQFLNESLNEKEAEKTERINSNESKDAVSDNEAVSEEAGDDNNEESENEQMASPDRSINPDDPSLQPVVKLSTLSDDTLKELAEPAMEEPSEPDLDAQPAILMNHFLDHVSKVTFVDMADEDLGDIKVWEDTSPSIVKFPKKDTGFMKSFLRFLKGEQEPSLVTPSRSSYVRKYEPNLPIKRAAVASTEPTKEDKSAETKTSEPSVSEKRVDANISRPSTRGRGRGRGGFVQMSRKREMDSDEENRPPQKVAREQPRRSSRRLRTKSNVSYRSMEYNSETEEEEYEVDDPVPATGGDDSDSDPAWSPVIARGDEEEDERIVESPPPPPPSRGRRRGRPGGVNSNRFVAKKKPEEISRTSENEEDSGSSQPSQGEKNPFSQGDFVVAKSEIGEMENPPIWRVDSKTLLQKYSAEKKDGKWLYSNISTYAGYTPQNVASYMKINVKIHNFSRNEAVVEWLRDDKAEEDGAVDVAPAASEEAPPTDTGTYQESFEIYIQTLISQALDVNFLTEIYQERDDYFVSNMEKIDKYTEKKKDIFLEVLEWKNEDFLKSMGGWPMVNVVKKTSPSEATQCHACDKRISTKLVLLYGQTYDTLTLAHCQADDFLANNKNWNLCEECANVTELYNKLVHQKYKYYIKCASRVANKRQDNPAKDTTDILNELLADDPWLNTLFKEARTVWSQVDAIEKNKAKD